MALDPATLLFDCSMVLLMLVLAYLSKRLGDAMKTAPFYILFHVAALLVVAACGADVGGKLFSVQVPFVIAPALRCAAGILSVAVSLRYWSWLFKEFFGV